MLTDQSRRRYQEKLHQLCSYRVTKHYTFEQSTGHYNQGDFLESNQIKMKSVYQNLCNKMNVILKGKLVVEFLNIKLKDVPPGHKHRQFKPEFSRLSVSLGQLFPSGSDMTTDDLNQIRCDFPQVSLRRSSHILIGRGLVHEPHVHCGSSWIMTLMRSCQLHINCPGDFLVV